MSDETPQAPSGQPPAVASAVRPDFIPKGDIGSEYMNTNDLQLPRIGLAQQMSKEIEDGHPKFIEGLRIGMFFNNLTRKVMEPSKGPIYFAVIRGDKPRYIEFNPREQGGGVKDMDVPASDPRTKFRKDPVDPTKSLPPLATKFYDYILFLVTPEGLPVDQEDEMANIIGLSLKSTGLKVARTLNGLIKFRNAPIYGGKYVLTSAQETNAKGTYFVYQIKNATNPANPLDRMFGWLPRETYVLAEKLHNSLKDRTIVMEREPGDEDDFPSEPGDTAAGGESRM